jgi:hypothetical protein
MLTEEQRLEMQEQIIKACAASTAMVVDASAKLLAASKKIGEQTDLIKRLSEDNLKLVAKLDELTGKKAPGTSFSA